MPHPRIVVIEDQEEVRENLLETLELAGYDVVGASDGHAGVQRVREHAPALVLCDVMMPKLDGFGVLELLRADASTAAIPFVFLSARTEREDLRRGMNLGAADYVTKPFFQDELLRVVQLRIAQAAAPSIHGGQVLAKAHTEDVKPLLAELRQRGRTRQYTDRATVCYEGDEALNVYYVQGGRLRSHRETSFGKTLTLDLYGAGTWVGIDDVLGGGWHAAALSAFPDATVVIVPKGELLALVHKHPALTLALARQLAQDVALRTEQLLQIAYYSVRKRVAESLLRFGEGPDKTRVELRREDIAEAIGTTPESVTRTLTELRKDGLVDLSTVGEVILLDRRALEQVPA